MEYLQVITGGSNPAIDCNSTVCKTATFQNCYIHLLDWTSCNQCTAQRKYCLPIHVNSKGPVQVCGPLMVYGFVRGPTNRSREGYKTKTADLDTVSIWAHNWAGSWLILDISWYVICLDLFCTNLS